jgi:predicted NBD/HSP70 family sugar kinase
MRGGAITHLREHNRAAVLRALLDHGPLSRKQLARLVHLSQPALSYLATDLLAVGLVTEAKSPTPGASAPRSRPRGAQAVPLNLASESRLVLTVHIGATGLAVGLANLRAAVQTSISRPLDHAAWGKQPRLLAEAVVEMLAALRTGGDVADIPVIGVGAGVAGWVDGRRGIVRRHPQLGWRDVPFAQLLGETLGLPAIVEDHVRGMALAEAWFGKGRLMESLGLLYVGAVVGCALVTGRQVYRGYQAAAGAIGELPAMSATPATSATPETPAGLSLEALVSEPAVYEAATSGPTSLTPDTLALWLGGWPSRGVPYSSHLADLVADAPESDPGKSLLRARAAHLAPFVTQFVAQCDPQALFVSGPLAWDSTGLQLRLLREAIEAHAPALAERLPPLLPYSFGERREQGVLVGAAASVLQEIFSPPLATSASSHAANAIRRLTIGAK